MKSAATTTSTARRRAAPKQAAEETSTGTAAPADQAPFAHALRMPPEWQSSLTEPWVEMTRGWMEMWSSWSQASTQMQMDAWRSMGLQVPESFAPTAEQMATLFPWAQQFQAQVTGKAGKRG